MAVQNGCGRQKVWKAQEDSGPVATQQALPEGYAPIEGEVLGVVWSLEKARMFTLGCPNLLVTVDHEPLISILGDKGLADIPNPRLYRFKE